MSKISVHDREATRSIWPVRPSSPNFAPLLDTPQTITIVGRSVAAAGRDDVEPSVTQHAGHHVPAWREWQLPLPAIRFSCVASMRKGSIFIDGIRDLGTISRDTFNTEQIEIAKGLLVLTMARSGFRLRQHVNQGAAPRDFRTERGQLRDW